MLELVKLIELHKRCEDLDASKKYLENLLKVREWQNTLYNMFEGGEKLKQLLAAIKIDYNYKTYTNDAGLEVIEYSISKYWSRETREWVTPDTLIDTPEHRIRKETLTVSKIQGDGISILLDGNFGKIDFKHLNSENLTELFYFFHVDLTEYLKKMGQA